MPVPRRLSTGRLLPPSSGPETIFEGERGLSFASLTCSHTCSVCLQVIAESRLSGEVQRFTVLEEEFSRTFELRGIFADEDLGFRAAGRAGWRTRRVGAWLGSQLQSPHLPPSPPPCLWPPGNHVRGGGRSVLLWAIWVSHPRPRWAVLVLGPRRLGSLHRLPPLWSSSSLAGSAEGQPFGFWKLRWEG